MKRLVVETCLFACCMFATLTFGWVQTQSRSTFHPSTAKMTTTSSEKDVPINFPMSTRAILLEKAKELDSKIANGERVGSYSASGWSNRLGTALTPASVPGVYTADRPFYWNKIDVGCRMTVIQLDNNDLWIHSPVGLDPQLQTALNKLGTVKYIVSPNYEHLKFAKQWYEAYPEAYMWGCPGLAERMPEINWTGEIPSTDPAVQPDALNTCWDFDAIRPLHVDMEVNPFTGKPFFNEVIFYHVPSKTLLTTDLYWNYPTDDGIPNSHLGGTEWELAPSVGSIPFGSKLWKHGMDKVYLPFYKNFMVTDKSKFHAMANILLEEWEIDTLIPAHGDIIRGSSLVRSVLKEHLE